MMPCSEIGEDNECDVVGEAVQETGESGGRTEREAAVRTMQRWATLVAAAVALCSGN